MAIGLETPADAAKLCQRFLHSRIRNIKLHGNGHSRQRIEHVVLARQVQHQRQVRQSHAIAPLYGEMHLTVDVSHIDGANLSLFTQPVTGDRARHLRHDLAQSRIIRTQNGRAVKRHAVQKIHKR